MFILFLISCIASALSFSSISALLARAKAEGGLDTVCAGVAFGAAPLIAFQLASPQTFPGGSSYGLALLAVAGALFSVSGLCSILIVRRYRLTLTTLAAASFVSALLGIAAFAAALVAQGNGNRTIVTLAAAVGPFFSFVIHWLVFGGRAFAPVRRLAAGAVLAAAMTASVMLSSPNASAALFAPERFGALLVWAALMFILARPAEKKASTQAPREAAVSFEDLPDTLIAFTINAENEVCAATPAARSFFRLEPSVPQGRRAPTFAPVDEEESGGGAGVCAFTDRAGVTHYIRVSERRIEKADVRRLVVAEPIGDRIAEQKRWRGLEARLSSVIDSNDDLLMFMSGSGIVTEINRCALHYLKKSRKECVGSYVWTLFSQTGKAPSVKRWRDLIAGAAQQEAVRAQATLPGGEEQSRLFKLTISKVRSGKNGVGEFVCFGRDITDITQARKSFQEAQLRLEQTIASRTRELQEAKRAADEANLSKSRFLANMSHELRTPLNAILGYTDLMRQDLLDERKTDTQEYKDLERVVVNARNLLNLINDILDLSKVEANKMTLSYSEVSVEALIEDVRASVDPLVGKRGNAFTVKAPDTLGSMVIDRQKLSQCLLNVLSNAAKFTEGGEISLTIWAREDAGAELIYFEVIDTGKGMTQQQCEAIFDEFVQVEDPDKLNAGGTGLGLPITKRLCQLMGGDIVAESAPGAGSRFTMWVRNGSLADGKKEDAA